MPPVPPYKVLIVEDEALLAMDIEAVVSDTGHRVVGDAASLSDVRALPVGLAPDLAFVDMQLAEGSSGLDVCRLILERWPAAIVVYVTANDRLIPVDFAGGHGIIAKPFTRAGLIAAIRYLEQGISQPPPTLAQPTSFRASEAFGQSLERE